MLYHVIILFIYLDACVYVSPFRLCIPEGQNLCLFHPCLANNRYSISIDCLVKNLRGHAGLSLTKVQVPLRNVANLPSWLLSLRCPLLDSA